MESGIPIEQALGVDDLRAGFLRHTRDAYALIPGLNRPRILDVGCGSGLPTIELARLGGGEIVGIDTDETSLHAFRRRIEKAGLEQRIKALNASIYDSGLPEGSFDVIWEEGVLHLLDSSSSLPECRRLLRPGGFLVMHETLAWFDGAEDRLESLGFSLFARHMLPERCWWTDYYAVLEARIRSLGPGRRDSADLAALAQYQREISMVKANPGKFDCGFFIAAVRRAGVGMSL